MRAFAVFLALIPALHVLGAAYWGTGDLALLAGGARGSVWGVTAAPFPVDPVSNPAGLGFAPGIRLSSAYARGFGVYDRYAVGALGPSWGAAVVTLEGGEVAQGLAYTAHGAVLGTGLAFGEHVAVGVAWKGFFQAEPTIAFGWALDPALAVRFGGVGLGLVLENVLSQPVDYGGHTEDWPLAARAGISLAFEAGSARILVVAGVRYRFAVAPAAEYGLGAEIGLGDLAFRAGYGPGGLAVGATVSFGGYAAHWFLAIHPDLPLSFGAGVSWASGE